MDWSSMEGSTLSLILMPSDEEEGGGIVRGIIHRSGEGFGLTRRSGPPFPLLPTWTDRVRRLDEVDDPEVRSLIGNVDFFLSLSVGNVKDDLDTEGLQSTGLNWNGFVAAEPDG